MNKTEEYLKLTKEMRDLPADVSDEIIEPMLDKLDDLWCSMGTIERRIVDFKLKGFA